MARNGLAGSHKSYDKRGMTEAQRKKKIAYDTKYHKTKKRKKYRASLNKANRDAGTYGNGDGLDMSHAKMGKKIVLVKEKASKNRARNGHSKGGKKKSTLKKA